MISPLKQEIVQTLAEIYELADDIRFGQLMCNLCALVECQTNTRAWDIEDEQMLEQLQAHRADLQDLDTFRKKRAAETPGV